MPHMSMVDAVHRAQAAMRCTADELEWVARNLRSVGLDKPAQQLEVLADPLRRSAEVLGRAYNADMTTQLGHSEAMVGNLLRATLAGCIRPPQEDWSEQPARAE